MGIHGVKQDIPNDILGSFVASWLSVIGLRDSGTVRLFSRSIDLYLIQT